jgi:hypothetical protein
MRTFLWLLVGAIVGFFVVPLLALVVPVRSNMSLDDFFWLWGEIGAVVGLCAVGLVRWRRARLRPREAASAKRYGRQ